MKIISMSFNHKGTIPPQYTCKGKNMSPPLEWRGAPKGTKSFVLICDDPDAPVGTWVHWVVYNIPGHIMGLDENIPPNKALTNGGKQGINDFRKIGYGGPCPPSGIHRYFFKLYALDTILIVKAGETKNDIINSMHGHILDECELIGMFGM